MHELAICRSIAQVALRHAEGRPVGAVDVKVGAFRQVVPVTLEHCWEFATATTPLEGSALRIEFVPAVVACGSCGHRTQLTEPVPLCDGCGSTAVTVIQGEELLVTSLELQAS
jgi:hydrogenase nickel incorporation protein HypA/HybF